MARLRHRVSEMGLVLRELRGDQTVADGPIEVATRIRDFNILTLKGPDGAPTPVPADSLVAFTAQSFRELMVDVTQGDTGELDSDGCVRRASDVWEFRVQTPEGTFAQMYVGGADIFFVRASSKVI